MALTAKTRNKFHFPQAGLMYPRVNRCSTSFKIKLNSESLQLYMPELLLAGRYVKFKTWSAGINGKNVQNNDHIWLEFSR